MTVSVSTPMAAAAAEVIVRDLGATGYSECLERMRSYTDARNAASSDEIWLTSHAPVYTLGQAGKPEHLLRANGIETVRTDRGGQITYHGPGQAVAYVLFDLHRGKTKIRALVNCLEQAAIDVLAMHGLTGVRKEGMPGVYTGAGAKIAAVGLRVRRGCSYHGMSLNVDCDLEPFADINTCGYPGLADTSMRLLGCQAPFDTVAAQLGERLAALLGAES